VPIEPQAQSQLHQQQSEFQGQALEQQGSPQQGGGADVQQGHPGVGPAGLMQALIEVQAVGLEDGLPCGQAAQDAQAGVPQQRETRQQQAQGQGRRGFP
jgi:hypothetical protein